jgi:hypothetical protein
MARDRRVALAASIQAERDATQPRIARFDKFERAEAVLGLPETSAAVRTRQTRGAVAARSTPVREAPLERVTRDSFTMPSSDYDKIHVLRSRYLQLGISVTKSEVLRAGLHALEQLNGEELRKIMHSVEKVKSGRPGR